MVILGSDKVGVGTLHVNLNVGVTNYYYFGNVNNLRPSTFSGKSFDASFGADALTHVGVGLNLSQKDKFGGTLLGTQYSAGIGFSFTVIEALVGVAKSNIVYVK